jgi:hypothetical protein
MTQLQINEMSINGLYGFLREFYPWVLPLCDSFRVGVVVESDLVRFVDLGGRQNFSITWRDLDANGGAGRLLAYFQRLDSFCPNRQFKSIETVKRETTENYMPK